PFLVVAECLGVAAAPQIPRFRAPVLLRAAQVVAALQEQDSLARRGQRVGQRPAARARADDDRVVVRPVLRSRHGVSPRRVLRRCTGVGYSGCANNSPWPSGSRSRRARWTFSAGSSRVTASGETATAPACNACALDASGSAVRSTVCQWARSFARRSGDGGRPS